MMGRTLFWYIFRDLFKIFMMANGALAGIMSFGGLLRPLTHQGLDVGQIGKLLGCFNMAMLTYSMPIAALFATTVVYGRLSADNELTACRAGGLSHLAVAFPAFVMGTVVALLSMVFLCFVVPIFTLKAEQTLYSNMAKLVAGNFQRYHKLEFGPINIFAQEAYVPPSSSTDGGQQMVVLKGPTIETIERPYKDQHDYHVPKDFYTASEAIIYIERQDKGEQRGTGKVYVTIHLEDGLKFPREFKGAVQAGIETTDYGPMELDSPAKEDPKFMDIFRLKALSHDPAKGTKVRRVIDDLVHRDQQIQFASHITNELNTGGAVNFQFSDGGSYTLKRTNDAPGAQLNANEVTLPAAPPVDELAVWLASQAASDAGGATVGLPPVPAMPMGPASGVRPITFQKTAEGQSPSVISAREARVHVNLSDEADSMRVNIELLDTFSATGGERRVYPVPAFNVPMTTDVRNIGRQGIEWYLHRDPNKTDQQAVGRILLVLSNQIFAESHSRVSFAISCLVLVMVGCALGMMFRSGNFLSAFAVSFIPALLTITLIVAGQRVSGNIPETSNIDFVRFVNTPLQLGLGLIWAGNCVNFVLAVGLLGRLQKK